jgi:hypothetical protein
MAEEGGDPGPPDAARKEGGITESVGIWLTRWYLLLSAALAGGTLVLIGVLVGYASFGPHSEIGALVLAAIGDALVVSAIAGATVERIFLGSANKAATDELRRVRSAADQLYAEKFFTDKYGAEVWKVVGPSIDAIPHGLVTREDQWNLTLTRSERDTEAALQLDFDRTYLVANTSASSQTYSYRHYSTSSRHMPHGLILLIDGVKTQENNKPTDEGGGEKVSLGVEGSVTMRPKGTKEFRVLYGEPADEVDFKMVGPAIPTNRFVISVKHPKDILVSFHWIRSPDITESETVSINERQDFSQVEARNVFPNVSFLIEWKRKAVVPPAPSTEAAPKPPALAGAAPKEGPGGGGAARG